MIGLPVVLVLIAGLVRRYGDPQPWFSGAHSVGDVLILAGLGILAFALVCLLFVLAFTAIGRED